MFSFTVDSLTLQPGHTYKLSFNPVRIFGTASVGIYRFYNVTSGSYFGHPADLYAAADGGVHQTRGLITAFITPTIATTINLRMTSVQGTITFGYPDTSYTDLSPCLTVETMN